MLTINKTGENEMLRVALAGRLDTVTAPEPEREVGGLWLFPTKKRSCEYRGGRNILALRKLG